jgi:uncharacterized protein YbjT (DUF2867 family)
LSVRPARRATLFATVAIACALPSLAKDVLLVAGGTGQTGREVVRAGLAAGLAVRGTTRDLARARAEFPQVEWFAVDVREPATLVAPMRGAKFVVAAIGARVWEGPESPEFIDGKGNVNLVDAASAAGAAHYVLISSGAAGSHRDQSRNTRLGGVLIWKTMAEEHLKASGLPYTIVGPAGLTDDPPRQRGLRAVRRENYQSSYVARADVARVAVDALTNPAALRKSFALYNDGGATTEVWRDDLVAMAPDAASTAARSPLDELHWLAGHWTAERDGGVQEELWLAPRGNVMPGLARETNAQGRTAFEYLRREARDGGIFYVAQPGGRPPTEFRLVERGTERAVFANPAHDFPQSLVYARDGVVLRARLEGEEGGRPRVLEYDWRLIGSK